MNQSSPLQMEGGKEAEVWTETWRLSSLIYLLLVSIFHLRKSPHKCEEVRPEPGSRAAGFEHIIGLKTSKTNWGCQKPLHICLLPRLRQTACHPRKDPRAFPPRCDEGRAAFKQITAQSSTFTPLWWTFHHRDTFPLRPNLPEINRLSARGGKSRKHEEESDFGEFSSSYLSEITFNLPSSCQR